MVYSLIRRVIYLWVTFNFNFYLIAQAASLAYNEETRRTFIGLDNGTISVCIFKFY